MHWKSIAGKDYLHRTHDRRGNAKSMGVRSPETEKTQQAFLARKNELDDRMRQLRERMEVMRRMNKALRLGSIAADVADVCIQINKAGLMGNGLTVVGTNAMYAYEALAGVRWTSDITATTDIDFLWHHQKRLSLAAKEELAVGGLIGILRKADRTFEILDTQPYRAVNANGYMVDLIRQTPSPPWREGKDRMSERHDLVAVDIANMRWLLDAPQISQAVIDQSGRMVNLTTPDPRVFAVFKLWLSEQGSREPVKRRRDKAQAQAVIAVVNEFLPQFSQDYGSLSSFPREILDKYASYFPLATSCDSDTSTGSDQRPKG